MRPVSRQYCSHPKRQKTRRAELRRRSYSCIQFNLLVEARAAEAEIRGGGFVERLASAAQEHGSHSPTLQQKIRFRATSSRLSSRSSRCCLLQRVDSFAITRRCDISASCRHLPTIDTSGLRSEISPQHTDGGSPMRTQLHHRSSNWDAMMHGHAGPQSFMG